MLLVLSCGFDFVTFCLCEIPWGWGGVAFIIRFLFVWLLLFLGDGIELFRSVCTVKRIYQK